MKKIIAINKYCHTKSFIPVKGRERSLFLKVFQILDLERTKTAPLLYQRPKTPCNKVHREQINE